MLASPRLVVVIATVITAGCSSCGSGANGDGMDGGTDTHSETEIDTDWDGGPLTPCEGEVPEGMVCVPGGTYLMGCMPYDKQCDPSELPLVEVTLSPFFIDIEETTYLEVIPFLNTLYDGYYRGPTYVTKGGVLDGGLDGDAIYIAAWGMGGPPIGLNDAGLYEWGEGAVESTCWQRPVIAASGCFGWLGAKEYCEWKGKRLPTEAEWEAAARGQTKWVYPCAWEHLPCWYGHYDQCDPDGECYWSDLFDDCCLPMVAMSVAECTSPNGVNRMYGNAAEWILDRRDSGSDHSWCTEGCVNPPPREGANYILKGGSVSAPAVYTRISANGMSASGNGGPPIGVRCVLSPVTFEDSPDSGADGGK